MCLKLLVKILLQVMDLNMTNKTLKTSKYTRNSDFRKTTEIRFAEISRHTPSSLPYILFYYTTFDHNNLNLPYPALTQFYLSSVKTGLRKSRSLFPTSSTFAGLPLTMKLALLPLASSFRPSFTSRLYSVEPRSDFGTRSYWDEMYQARGDFPADEYSWYFPFGDVKSYLSTHIATKDTPLLFPGIGNDPFLLEAYQQGYKNVVAFDYSEHAIERQRDLLSIEPGADSIELSVQDARELPASWGEKFGGVVEKGCLDAIYLSGDGQLELAVAEIRRVLAPGGTLISISGVVPAQLRRELFCDDQWGWVRDGAEDLKAGTFVLTRR